jgi:CheY-like chemotaxis protein
MGRRVLVVDDDLLVLEVLASMLEELDCETILARSGTEALGTIANDQKITPNEYRLMAKECLLWARQARSDDVRDPLIELARMRRTFMAGLASAAVAWPVTDYSLMLRASAICARCRHRGLPAIHPEPIGKRSRYGSQN